MAGFKEPVGERTVVCRACGVTFTYTVYTNTRPRTICTYECRRKFNRANNIAKAKARYRVDEAYRQERAEQNKLWKDTNRNYVNAYMRDWYASRSPEQLAPYQEARTKRRLRKLKSSAGCEPITAADLADLLEEFNGGCAYCPEPFEHWDHVIPLARGGDHSKHNLVPACAFHNLQKGAKTLFEFAGAQTPNPRSLA